MSAEVKNPLVQYSDLVEESLDSSKAPLSITAPDNDDNNNNYHDHHHNSSATDATMSPPAHDSHDPNPPPTKLPPWAQDALEKVFKLKKGRQHLNMSVIVVSFNSYHVFMYCLLFLFKWRE